ncbi:MAG: HD domain-containing protein [Bacteroidales bacterium]|jgi:poly(A) polymerase|nr:HD domain-containing protein [Bacteroidales bacterium]
MTITEGYLEHPVFKLVGETARELGVRAFVIGGYVRDCFLGRPNKDIDIVVEGSGIALAEAIAKKTKARVSVFKNFGTAMLKYHGMEVEFVGARKESYHRESRKPIVEDGTLEEDQLRRDFTINAMAFSLQAEDYGALVDPFGGIKDLAAGIIRTPLEPEQTYSDDPLRMLRAIRFAARLSTPEHPFTIVPESIAAMTAMADRLQILSKERIVEELNKMLMTDHPSKAFETLEETGLLKQFLPELSRLKGVETVDGKGHKENFTHTLQVLENVIRFEKEEGREPNLWLHWAALLHDIGKPISKRYVAGQGWTFHGHEVVGARMVPEIFQKLKMPLNEKMKYVQKLVNLHLRPIALVDDEVTDSAVRRLLFDAGEDIDDLMLLCNADITSKNPAKVARLRRNFELVKEKMAEVEAKDEIRNWKNPITGDYIMQLFGLEPCSTIGELKEMVKNAVLDGEIPYTFEAADAYMRAKAREMGLEPHD